jgi:hypothetical protein
MVVSRSAVAYRLPEQCFYSDTSAQYEQGYANEAGGLRLPERVDTRKEL